MAEEKLIGFGFQSDEDESLKGKSSGSFGLNSNAVITKFEYSPVTTDDSGKEFQENIALEILVNGATMKQWWYPITKVFAKGGGEIEDKTSPEYIAGFNEQMKVFKSVMTHYLKIKHTEEELKAAFATPMTTFGDFGKKVEALIKDTLNTPIDVFLQYQWNIKEGSTRTFLELPKNLKDGSFVTAHIEPVGSWKEVRDSSGLRYTDDANNEHRFKRSTSYLESPKANLQEEGKELSAQGSAMNAGASSSAAPKW